MYVWLDRPSHSDPTFLALGAFPCTFTDFPICGEDGVIEACGLSCLSCPICEDPDPVDGVEVIFQTAGQVGGGDNIIIYIDSSEAIAGVQASVACLSDGESR